MSILALTHMRSTLALLVLAACPGPPHDKRPLPPVPPPPLPGNEAKTELPEVPAKIDVTSCRAKGAPTCTMSVTIEQD